jgi:hypothetical protein
MIRSDDMTTTNLYFDADTLEAVYTEANRNPMEPRWQNALIRGYDLLLAADAIEVEFAANDTMTVAYIPSQRGDGTIYTVNGECDCEAGRRGNPCAHRAAKRLLERARAYTAARQVAERAARKRSSIPGALGVHRDGTPKTVSYEQAMRNMAELFPD